MSPKPIKARRMWASIQGWPGYEVSRMGQVRSLARAVTDRRGITHFVKARKMKPGLDTKGYRSILLSKVGRRWRVKIASLVAQYFIGPRPKGHEVNHIRGNKKDDRAHKLEYATRSRNQVHGHYFAAPTYGERHPNAKTTDRGAMRIRKLRRNGVSVPDIAAMFGVHKATVYRIIRGDRYPTKQRVDAVLTSLGIIRPKRKELK